ncbi:MAG: TonB-dependent receptor [Rhodothermales bacterium]|nr:TonB-dependent receptor [Rhodothermales bacterium]
MPKHSCRFLFTAIAFLVLLTPARAWSQDTLSVELPPVRVEAARGAFDNTGAPAAVSVSIREPERRQAEPALSLESVLSEMPGLWMADRSHLAIGERLVVRGVGSRAAFGVRSVAVLLDGILLTMPDGQAVLDPIEPAVLARAELIRGPSSRFWGNAAGGVLAIESGSIPAAGRRTTARALGGSDGTLHFLAETAGRTGRTGTSAFASVLDRTGFREHADGRMTRGGFRVVHSLTSGAVVTGSINASDLDTRSPGSLTLEQWEADPSAADARYVNTQSGKRAWQVQATSAVTVPLAGGVGSGSLFGLRRSLDNPLPFAWIGVERTAGGARAAWRKEHDAWSIALGGDWRLQSDDRINGDNVEGARGGTTDVDQTEDVSGLGGSIYADYRVSGSLKISAGLRADLLSVSLEDRITGDGDDSGSSSFSALSPSVGITLTSGPTVLFASFSTAFEIPTTTELVNSPDGSAGFNDNLSPQRLTGVELGLRHAWEIASIDIAAYEQRLTNFLTPYQLEAFPGRTFYRNVGRVNYIGFETRVQVAPVAGFAMDGSISVHRYRFGSGTLSGNQVPGLPSVFGSVRLARALGPVAASTRLRFAGAQAADDGNDVEIDGFYLLDLRLAHRRQLNAAVTAAPFLEVTNVLDGNHVISIIPNARGGRYYEGLPGRGIQLGMALSF